MLVVKVVSTLDGAASALRGCHRAGRDHCSRP